MRRKTIYTLVTGAMALCLALMPARSAPVRDVADAEISSAITGEILADNAISANNVNVSTDDGIVLLTGTVNSILAKDRIQELTEATVGVRAVVNNVKVRPDTPRSDAELKKAVGNAWRNDAAVESTGLTASAENGTVTLTGAVDSFAEKQLAETAARGVRGVKKIRNDITIGFDKARPDREIQAEISQRLINDIRIDDNLIEVHVTNGTASLSGSVGSLQEKNQAADDSWVAGVTSVNTAGLEIEWWARDDMRRTETGIARSDAAIKKAVEDAFYYDPRVRSFNPDVKVLNGTVTLSGEVSNLQAKRAAEQDAKNTLGVWRVKNHLKVRPQGPPDDILEQRVSAALKDNPYVARRSVTVDADNGWIYLSGDVNTTYEKNQAERVAEGIKGVVGVVNNIDFESAWDSTPDWEIRENVKEQLRWSPFVDEENITVSVTNGVVTLSGTVDSWSGLIHAEENALQGGAKNVINDLTADYRYYGPRGPGYYGSYIYQDSYYYPY
ncbi:MAG TPA: BON domain-containing protein [Tichowtungia sp.]|nr:BON domain-containing protein [Tichowtungia sp.]